MVIHVMPENDGTKHTWENCWCNPRVCVLDPETGEPLPELIVVHSSADGREIQEERNENGW